MNNQPLIIAVSERRKTFFKKWLNERILDTILAEDLAPSESGEQTPLVGIRIRSFDEEVKEGQIRLLSACLRPTRLHYVLVVDVDSERGCATVASFSPYGAPACTTEWLTGLEGKPLRVLELFSAGPALIRDIAKSWIVEELSPEKVAVVQQMHREIMSGLTPTIERENIGLPIRNVDDPRLPYIEEENALMEELRANVLADFFRKEQLDELLRFACIQAPLRMAASSGGIAVPVRFVHSDGSLQETHLSAHTNRYDETYWTLECDRDCDADVSVLYGLPCQFVFEGLSIKLDATIADEELSVLFSAEQMTEPILQAIRKNEFSKEFQIFFPKELE